MTSSSVEGTVNEFIRRIVARDIDAACELVSDDVEYDNVPIGKNHGPDGLKSVLAGFVGGFDEVDWVIHRQTSSGNVVMNERSDRFRRGDRWMDLPVAGLFEVNADGKVSLWRDYFDLGTFQQQMAALTAG